MSTHIDWITASFTTEDNFTGIMLLADPQEFDGSIVESVRQPGRWLLTAGDEEHFFDTVEEAKDAANEMVSIAEEVSL